MPEGGKFLNKSQIKAEAKKWQTQANRKERPLVTLDNGVYDYHTSRIDTENENRSDSIDSMHGISFIEDVVPTLIANNPGRKVQILDVGAGMTMFTNQIRDMFGDKVRVFSTGLSKQAFKAELRINANKHYMAMKEYPSALHPDDLKWRFIRELSNFEEFDLIVDTYGEFSYSRNDKMMTGHMHQRELPKAFEYISIIAAKLRPGGLASLAPISFNTLEDKKEFEKWLRHANAELGVSFDLMKEPANFNAPSKVLPYVLRIRKPKRKNE